MNKVDMFRKDETFCPPSVIEIGEKPTRKNCDVIVEELKSLIVSTIRKTEEFKKAVTQFNGNFSSKNTFHFRTELVGEQDTMISLPICASLWIMIRFRLSETYQ